MSTSQTVISEDDKLPPHVNYWLTASEKHDCFFIVGPESGAAKRIGAFKLFLIGHSEPLRNMLEDSELAERDDVTITDVEPQTFVDFLKCIYGGFDIVIRNISFEDSLKLLYVIDKYLVLDLRPKVVNNILKTLPISVSFTLKALSHPVCLQDESLKQALSYIVSIDTQQIISHDGFVNLSNEGLLFIVMQDSLQLHSEVNIWEAVLKWARFNIELTDGECLRLHIIKFLKYIRFCSMCPEEICGSVAPLNILRPDEIFEICKCLGTSKPSNMEQICNSTQKRTISRPIVIQDEMVTFFHIVEDICHLGKKGKECDSFISDLYSWKLNLRKRNNYLGLYVFCKSREELPYWKCKAQVEFVLINLHENPNISRRTPFNEFCQVKDSWGCHEFINWDEFIDPNKGFVENNKFIIIVHVMIEPS